MSRIRWKIDVIEELLDFVIPRLGYVAAVVGVITTFLYRRKSVRQLEKNNRLLQENHDLQARRSERRIEVTHVAVTEFAAYDPHILLVRIVLRNLSDRHERVSSVCLRSEDKKTSAQFDGPYDLEGNGIIEAVTECWRNGGMPSQAVIRLVDGSTTHDVQRESMSHGVFTGYAQPWIPELAREREESGDSS